MQRFTPSARRLLSLGGAVLTGIAVSAMLAAPASAHDAELKGTTKCEPNGTFTVTWTLHNENGKVAKLSNAEFAVRQGAATKAGTGELSKNEVEGDATTEVAVQTGVPAKGVAKLKVHVEWFDKRGNKSFEKDVEGKDTPCGECKPKPAPSESESTPPGGGGGGGGAPSTPASPSTPAKPTLPVTGSQAAIYGGGAAVLLGAGAGLFFVARRRRITFEA